MYVFPIEPSEKPRLTILTRRLQLLPFDNTVTGVTVQTKNIVPLLYLQQQSYIYFSALWRGMINAGCVSPHVPQTVGFQGFVVPFLYGDFSRPHIA